MKRISFGLVFFCSFSAFAAIKPMTPVWNGIIEKPVRVRLVKDMNETVIRGFGLAVQGQKGPFTAVGTSNMGVLRVERVQSPRGPLWKIKKEERGQEKIELKSDPVLVIEGKDLRRGGQSLPNRLILHAKPETFDLIGVLPLENYLVGVISSEMPMAWPIEAIKAQTVAARSYTLAVMRERKNRHFDVESNILDQMFNHVSQDMDDDPMIQKAKRAVSETRGVVLLDRQGKVNKAYYHADCGGRTAPAKVVWGAGEKTPIVVDASCPGHPRSQWVLSLSEKELRAKLKTKWSMLSPLTEIMTMEGGGEDRNLKLKLHFANADDKIVNAHEFREAVGYNTLRSTFFTVEKKENIFEFRGRGWGHGVGLCQWGSRKLAEQGTGASEILKHYYPLSHLTADIKSSPQVAQRRIESPQ